MIDGKVDKYPFSVSRVTKSLCATFYATEIWIQDKGYLKHFSSLTEENRDESSNRYYSVADKKT